MVLSMISLMSVFLGVGLCLVKSPATQSSYYLAMAGQYQSQAANGDAATTVTKEYLITQADYLSKVAVYMAPHDIKIWGEFSKLQSQINQFNPDNADLALLDDMAQ